MLYLIINEYPKVVAYNVYSQIIYIVLLYLGLFMAQTFLFVYMKPWQKYTSRYNSRCLTELHMFCVPDSLERIIAGFSGIYYMVILTSNAAYELSSLNNYVICIMFLGYLSPWRCLSSTFEKVEQNDPEKENKLVIEQV